MTIPVGEQYNFIVCEDIRREHDGRYSFIGVSTNRKFRVVKDQNSKPGDKLGFSKLCIAYSFTSGEYSGEAALTIEWPSGKPIIEKASTTVLKEATKSLDIVVEFAPLVIEEFGVCRAILQLGSQVFEQTFEIQRG